MSKELISRQNLENLLTARLRESPGLQQIRSISVGSLMAPNHANWTIASWDFGPCDRHQARRALLGIMSSMQKTHELQVE